MIFLIIALALAVAAAGILAWRLRNARQALSRAEAACKSLREDRAIRQNLQHILERREAELRRLRAQLRQHEAEAQEMESRASELNLTLFRESGLRILAEKEEGAKRMKMDLMEKQLDEANRRLRAAKAEADESGRALREVIARQSAQIERLTAAQTRRPARRGTELPNQITLGDILGEADGGRPGGTPGDA